MANFTYDISIDGKLAIAGESAVDVFVLDGASRFRYFPQLADRHTAVKFSRHSGPLQLLAAATKEAVAVWNVLENKPIAMFKISSPNKGTIRQLFLSVDGQRVLVLNGKILTCYNLYTQKIVSICSMLPTLSNNLVVFNATNTVGYSVTNRVDIVKFSASNGSVIESSHQHRSPIIALNISPQVSHTMLSLDASGTVLSWNLKTGAYITLLTPTNSPHPIMYVSLLTDLVVVVCQTRHRLTLKNDNKYINVLNMRLLNTQTKETIKTESKIIPYKQEGTCCFTVLDDKYAALPSFTRDHLNYPTHCAFIYNQSKNILEAK